MTDSDNLGNKTKTRKIKDTSLNNLSKPGRSNNPNGRPKQPKEFKDIVKNNTVTAINAVIEIMNDPNAKGSDRIKAAEIVMDRAYGKATQLIAGDSEHDALIIEVSINNADS